MWGGARNTNRCFTVEAKRLGWFRDCNADGAGVFVLSKTEKVLQTNLKQVKVKFRLQHVMDILFN